MLVDPFTQWNGHQYSGTHFCSRCQSVTPGSHREILEPRSGTREHKGREEGMGRAWKPSCVQALSSGEDSTEEERSSD